MPVPASLPLPARAVTLPPAPAPARPAPRAGEALTGQVKPNGKRMGLLKAGSAPAPSGRLKESTPSTGVTALP